MSLRKIAIHNIRNLEDQELNLADRAYSKKVTGYSEGSFAAKLVVISGPNGSGKTSFLEAISILLNGRSFRTGDLEVCLKHGNSLGRVTGLFQDEHGLVKKIGIEKEKGLPQKIALDGGRLRRASDLVKLSPLLALEPEVFNLINGGPGERRRFLDFGLFHVEHDFNDLFSSWRITYRQRLALIKQHRVHQTSERLAELETWTKQFVTLSYKILKKRSDYSQQINSLIASDVEGVSEYYASLKKFNIEFALADIGTEAQYLEHCQALLDREIRFGKVLFGPQLQKIRLLAGGLEAKDKLSRGQQKKVIMTLKLLQLKEILKSSHKSGFILLDDFGAELDVSSQNEVLTEVLTTRSQIFLTTLDRQVILELPVVKQMVAEGVLPVMFHVEHGVMTPLND